MEVKTSEENDQKLKDASRCKNEPGRGGARL